MALVCPGQYFRLLAIPNRHALQAARPGALWQPGYPESCRPAAFLAGCDIPLVPHPGACFLAYGKLLEEQAEGDGDLGQPLVLMVQQH